MPPRTGYLVAPASGSGPGVLVLHSWWGPTPAFRRMADRLADEGFVALVPDLNEGVLPTTSADAAAALAAVDPNVVADLVISSAVTLRGLPLTPDEPIAVIGFSMGASWALWLAARQPRLVGAVATFYGTQSIGFEDATARFQVHAAEHDELVSDDDMVLLEAALHLDGHDADVHRYPGTSHWFMEADRPASYDADAAALAWERMLGFLRDV